MTPIPKDVQEALDATCSWGGCPLGCCKHRSVLARSYRESMAKIEEIEKISEVRKNLVLSTSEDGMKEFSRAERAEGLVRKLAEVLETIEPRAKPDAQWAIKETLALVPADLRVSK